MPKRRFGKHGVFDSIPLVAVFRQQTGPDQGAQDLGVEARQITVVLRLRIGAIKYAIDVAASDAVFGLDIQHIQENIPVAKWPLGYAGKAQVIELEQIERGDDAKQPPGMVNQRLARFGQAEAALVISTTR